MENLDHFHSEILLQQRAIPAAEIAENELDLSENYDLLDPNVQKTGNAVTLKYDSVMVKSILCNSC